MKDNEIAEAVKSSFTYAEVLRKLGRKIAGGNYQTLKSAIERLELDTSHMTGQGWHAGKTAYHDTRISSKYNPDEIFKADSTVASTTVRKILLAEGRGKKCEKCSITSWEGSPLTFEMDHINGIRFDHRRENLRFLCPNCHSQTPTYRYRGGSRYRGVELTEDFLVEEIPKFESVKDLIRSHNLSWSGPTYQKIYEVMYGNQVSLKPKPSNRKSRDGKKHPSLHACVDCGIRISRTAKRCKPCAGKHHRATKIDWPETSTLIQMVRESNFRTVSKELGVSDNAIRKRLRNHLGPDWRNHLST